jgi:hypothetical protein
MHQCYVLNKKYSKFKILLLAQTHQQDMVIAQMGFTYDFYANRRRMCSISYYFRNSSASINNVTNVNYDIDLQKMYMYSCKMPQMMCLTDHATRVPWTPGNYDVVC